MIEVEKKFSLNSAQANSIVKDSKPLGVEVFIDSYLDTKDYSLTSKDIWLRLRGNKAELKLPRNASSMSMRQLDQYEELVSEEEIRKALNLPAKGVLIEDLVTSGYKPFCTITTTRKKYQNSQFSIVLDDTDFGYSIAEIELMVGSEEEVNAAKNKIIYFAEQRGLSVGLVWSKVMEYIRRNNPEHFDALVTAGVI